MIKNEKVTAMLTAVDGLTDPQTAEKAIKELSAKRISEIASTTTEVKVTGKSYYVSADGNDENDGQSPENAWKTTSRVSRAAKYEELNSGDGVFFRRGDLFRGRFGTCAGVTYSAYGKGEKPKIYGSLRDYSETPFWDKTDKKNIYVSKEAFDTDIGLIVFDGGKAWTVKKIVGTGDYEHTLDLQNDLEMCQDVDSKLVYLYSESDPNKRFSSTEIAPGKSIIGGKGCGVTIDNLTLRYTGGHCIGYGNNTEGLTVQNCEIGWIGGMIQYYRPDGKAVRFGNGVEIYVSCKDYTITNCYIYEVYDAGITHQYFASGLPFVGMENIEYSHNVIDRCTYAIEYCNAQAGETGMMKNVRIFDNILTNSGDGWGNQRPDHGDSVIKGWSLVNRSENFNIIENIVASNSSMLIHIGVGKPEYLPKIDGNIFKGKTDRDFIYGINPAPRLPYCKESTDKIVGSKGNTFIYKSAE